MVIAWRYFYGSGVFNLKYIDDAYNCRYTFRYANIEVGRTCFVAFWKRSKEWWAFKRMPLYTDECFMDILGGIWICLSHLVFGAVLCITIIGIPFGLQHFKLAALALSPFGKDIVGA